MCVSINGTRVPMIPRVGKHAYRMFEDRSNVEHRYVEIGGEVQATRMNEHLFEYLIYFSQVFQFLTFVISDSKGLLLLMVSM